MKDFCTLREIDIQALMRMARHAEEAEEFTMFGYITRFTTTCGTAGFATTCGTAGCLVGTFCIAEGLLKGAHYLEFNSIAHAAARELFGISPHEVDFLFHGGHLERLEFAGKSISRRTAKDADVQTKEQAIRRLRKFILWKCRKAELLENHEASRRLEGNQDYAAKARVEAEGVLT